MITYTGKIWKYIPFSVWLFLIAAVYLFANAVQTAALLNRDVERNGKVICMLKDRRDEEIVSQFSEGREGSYVYEAEVRILCQSRENTVHVTGIDGNMITGNMICGTCYGDDDSSLLLIANRTFIAWLMDKETVAAGDALTWIDQSLVMGEYAAKIIGVIDDGSEMPEVYISSAAAKSYFEQQKGIMYTKSYCIMASDLESMEAIQKEMNENGITTSIDQQKLFDWEIHQVKIKDQIIMGVIALLGFLSSASLTVKKRKQ